LNGFERRTERKKAAVRQAALELFRDHGVRRVTVGEIARRAAVSPVTIYNHFGSKEDLVRDAVKHFLSAMMEKYQAIILSDRPFLEKLESIVFDKTQIAATSNEEFMQTLVSNDPEIREFIDTMFQGQIRRMMTDFFEDGQRQGYIDPAVPLEMFLLYTDVFRQGILAHPHLLAAPEQNEKLIRGLSQLYLYGVMGQRDRESEHRGVPEGS
jgi:AcrR family transcriptional regulator